MGGLDLLPALGRARRLLLRVVVLAVSAVVLGAGPARTAPFWPPGHRPAPAVGRVALPRTSRWTSDRNRSPLATRRRHLPAGGQEVDPGDLEASASGHPGAPRTGAGPGHPGHSRPRYPRPGDRSKPGPSHKRPVAGDRPPGRTTPCRTTPWPRLFPA